MGTTGPDFLCIGMQKAGTGWLFDQLQHHPEFWMPPIKEFHYFDRDFPDKKVLKQIASAERGLKKLEKKRRQTNWRPLDERDLGFFSDVAACRGRGPELATYVQLFKYKEDAKSGDITPAYCGLEERVIGEITDYLPDLKVILLLRDPVARAWSQISMSFRRGKFETAWADDETELQAFLEWPAVRVRSYATEIYDRWNRYVPADRLKFFFFDDIEREPDTVRREILKFLGADPGKESGELTPDFNRKSEQVKLEMTDVARETLIRHFAEEIRNCAGKFGGPANDWLTKYSL